ncbi:DUF1642 domain-containing protein [Enterococcus dongliensis]|uniref:DUF1642 domain-containing protein n=1 Tax=Enterococcus dongliensis TaxID=2559925 RepID=A0AAW8TPI1_9ENTE|nr:DUF1642 domain-containing protein [Enterococcus dongliensis]MDT2637960.1 DUF1642 domain-containing protein [Enterococcus dongliensis]
MNKGSKYKSGQRPTFRIWDNEKNDWFEPTYEGWDGKIEELLLSPTGDLAMRTFTDFKCESVFPERFEIVLDEPQKVKVPELPSKIAKYLEWAKEEQFDFTEDYNMISWEDLRKFGGDDTEYLQMWFFDNDQKENERRHILFLQAYTDGYEVEEEQLYQVIINGDYLIKLFDNRNDHKFVGKEDLVIWLPSGYQLTEAEIKAIDERYWPFAVPAEKV